MANINMDKDGEENPARCNTTQDAFPLLSEQHGSQIVVVRVGYPDFVKTFYIHRSLLASASPYYSRLLQGGFRESNLEKFVFDNDCPIAFEVLYQYLYSGQVLKAKFYTRSRIPDDVLWLRTYKLAHHTQVGPLLYQSYENIRQLFRGTGRVVPSTIFITELYEDDDCQEELRLYAVAHVAFWIYNYSYGDWREWEALLKLHPPFGMAVSIHLAKMHSSVYDGSREHPSHDAAFDADVVLAAFTEKVLDPAERTTDAAQWVLEKSEN